MRETDQMGVVYHGNYAQYFEMGRGMAKKLRGFVQMDGRKRRYTSCGFIDNELQKPARYDDLLTVKTILKSQTSVKIEFDYEIYNEANELLTTGYSMLVFVDMKTGRQFCLQSYVSEKINSFLEV